MQRSGSRQRASTLTRWVGSDKHPVTALCCARPRPAARLYPSRGQRRSLESGSNFIGFFAGPAGTSTNNKYMLRRRGVRDPYTTNTQPALRFPRCQRGDIRTRKPEWAAGGDALLYTHRPGEGYFSSTIAASRHFSARQIRDIGFRRSDPADLYRADPVITEEASLIVEMTRDP